MVSFIRKRVFGVGITIAVILGAVVVASRFDIGGRLIGAAGGAGSTIPNILSAFTGSFAEGVSGLGANLASIGENFQRAISGGLLFSEQEAFGGAGVAGGTLTEQTLTTQAGADIPQFLSSLFQAKPSATPSSARVSSAQRSGSVLSVRSVFTPEAQTRRISFSERNAAELEAGRDTGTTAFGGFSSSFEQEAELQRQLAESRRLFPEFFTD